MSLRKKKEKKKKRAKLAGRERRAADVKLGPRDTETERGRPARSEASEAGEGEIKREKRPGNIDTEFLSC